MFARLRLVVVAAAVVHLAQALAYDLLVEAVARLTLDHGAVKLLAAWLQP